jgi:hypothetical protein
MKLRVVAYFRYSPKSSRRPGAFQPGEGSGADQQRAQSSSAQGPSQAQDDTYKFETRISNSATTKLRISFGRREVWRQSVLPFTRSGCRD